MVKFVDIWENERKNPRSLSKMPIAFPMSKQTKLITCSASLLICISSSAFSQDQQKSQSIAPLAKPAQVEITAKSEAENARRDAAAKTVISNAELVRYGDSNITEAITIQTNPNRSYRALKLNFEHSF